MIDTASTSVRTVSWKLPKLRSFAISCVPNGNNPRPLETICPFTNFSGLRQLRRLKIESHPADVDFLVQLSSFPDLAHLQIVISQSLPADSRQTRDGFRSLVSLHITAHVSSMPRILRLIHPGSLTSLTYIDAYSQSYNEIGEFMQDFHGEIVLRFPSLLTLSLNYRHITDNWLSNIGNLQGPFLSRSTAFVNFRHSLITACSPWKTIQSSFSSHLHGRRSEPSISQFSKDLVRHTKCSAL